MLLNEPAGRYVFSNLRYSGKKFRERTRNQRYYFFKSDLEWYSLLVYYFKDWFIQTVLPYERLTDPQEGPLIVQQLARQLESAGFQVATDLECQWHETFVHLAYAKRAPHRYSPSYTAAQKLKLLQVVNRALIDLSNHSVMIPILRQYLLNITNSVTVAK
jgi:hypothetical protein